MEVIKTIFLYPGCDREEIWNSLERGVSKYNLNVNTINQDSHILRINMDLDRKNDRRVRCSALDGTEISDIETPHLELHTGNLNDGEYNVSSELCRKYIDVVKQVYLAVECRPEFVYSISYLHDAPRLPIEADVSDQREYLTWLDIYPPDRVEKIGREKLLSAPAPRVEELDDGSVLIASKHPHSANGGQLPRVGTHLGIPPWVEFMPI